MPWSFLYNCDRGRSDIIIIILRFEEVRKGLCCRLGQIQLKDQERTPTASAPVPVPRNPLFSVLEFSRIPRLKIVFMGMVFTRVGSMDNELTFSNKKIRARQELDEKVLDGALLQALKIDPDEARPPLNEIASSIHYCCYFLSI